MGKCGQWKNKEMLLVGLEFSKKGDEKVASHKNRLATFYGKENPYGT